MRVDDLMWQSFRPLAAYKLRTVLSLLGILIGIAAVMALLTLMESASASVSGRIQQLGTNLVVVTMNPMVDTSNSARTLSLKAADGLRSLSGVAMVAPANYQAAAVTYDGQSSGVTVYGASPALTTVLQYRLAYGRYLTAADESARLNVTLLGADTSRQLFGRANPVGKTVMIGHEPYQVVGVLAAKGAFFNVNQDAVAVIPITTFHDQQHVGDVNSVYLRASSTGKLPIVLKALDRRFRHLFGNSNQYTIVTQSEMLGLTSQIAHLLTEVLVGVATISIVVGGIGMLNMLLISVSERIREIGVRKSLGARRRDLLLQFLLESMMISFTGGILGVGVGWGLSLELTRVLGIPMVFSPVVPPMALGASILLGIVFGIYPAARASRMDPAEALRFE